MSLDGISASQFEALVSAEVDGWATPEQLGVLQAHRTAWRTALLTMIRDTDERLTKAQSLRGPERELVIADLESERERMAEAWSRVTGEPRRPVTAPTRREPRETRDGREDGGRATGPSERNREARPARERPEPRRPEPEEEPLPVGPVQLQVSWETGRVVAWAAGHGTAAETAAELAERLARAGAPSTGWSKHGPISVPGGPDAPAVAIPVGEVLGWLVAAGAGQVEDVGPSVRWLGQVAGWAVELCAGGSVVPQLRQRKRSGGARDATGTYAVRWTPALVDAGRLRRVAAQAPGSVLACEPGVDRRALTRSVLTGMVEAVYRQGARSLVLPAPPPHVRSAYDVGETVLARLDGSTFDAPVPLGAEVVDRMEQWSRPVTNDRPRLLVRLDPPDTADAWHLAVFVAETAGQLTPLAQAIADAGPSRRQVEAEVTRLERLLPVLRRASAARRGEVALGQDEAWQLMATTGPQLLSAGFDVQVPALSRRTPRPELRVYADSSAPLAVGASQLANVTWSAVFGDVELSAEDIARLAAQARPLIRSGGRWVAVEKADLAAAAAALAERADTKHLSGAEMLRLALGLEASPLAGGVSVGRGWAADLMRAASTVEVERTRPPDGFVGERRSYQATALAWLGVLESVGLGGCLALDMGLGKTPTVLAHLLAGVGEGPALVIAPAAVVGNWAAEAARFTPSLRVLVHHGAERASLEEIADEVAEADIVITTYATAVRDVDAIEAVAWERLVLDEAQAIKNPSSETAQQLRRIRARVRLALTGTPVENGLGDLWAILDFTNPGLVGPRQPFIAQLSRGEDATRVAAEDAMRALNGILVFRRTKAEPAIAAELPDRIDELDHCVMTPEQIGLYQAVLDTLVTRTPTAADDGPDPRKGQILAAITALKQICDHPAAYQDDDRPLAGRSGKLARLEEIVDAVFAAGEKVLVFTHFAEWGVQLAGHLTERTGTPVACYHGGLTRVVRDRMVEEFQTGDGPGALVLSLKAGGTGLNLTAASHVVLYDRWWNPAVEDQARDRAWRIGQERTVICHRLVCPGTVDERVEEVVAGKRHIADLVLPKSSSLADLDNEHLKVALGLRGDSVLTEEITSEPGAVVA
jgi:hypothetical protein